MARGHLHPYWFYLMGGKGGGGGTTRYLIQVSQYEWLPKNVFCSVDEPPYSKKCRKKSLKNWFNWYITPISALSEQVSTNRFLNQHISITSKIYTRWYSNNQFLTVSSFSYDSVQIAITRHGRMWACARGERRSREKWERNSILSPFFVPFRSPRVALQKKRRPLAVYVKINRRIPLFSMSLFCGYHSPTTLLWIVFVLKSPPTKLVWDRTNFPERKLTECCC